MRNLAYKELKLSASKLSYFFIAFGLLTFCPGYPILLGAFFVTLGIFQSFQLSRTTNDVLYTVMLPVAKSDIVRGKYLFCVIIELSGFAVSLAAVLLRMGFMSELAVYRENALMTANFAFLGYELLVFGAFNMSFVRGYYKTAYYFTKPFVIYIVISFLIIAAAEALWHFPHMGVLNSFGFEHMGAQLSVLCIGAVLYAAMTLLSMRRAIRDFELIDL